MRGIVVCVLVVLGCGGGGGGGDGGATFTQEQATDACVSLTGCLGADGLNDCFTDILTSFAPATVRCLAAARSDCAAVSTCLGATITAAPACTPGTRCDGNNLVECVDGVQATTACGNVETTGPSCVTSTTGRGACGVTTCTTDSQTCNGSVLEVCQASQGILKERDCADFGLDCISGVCTSPGGGGACTQTTVHCNGTAIEDCTNGVTALLDCPSRVPGSTCYANATDAYCGFGDECFPTKGAETCNGTSITFCANGITTTLDCTSFGFTRCSFGRCAP